MCWVVFSSTAPLVLGKARTFFFEDVGSVATSQTVGTEVISFPAFGMVPELPIEKLQIGIFMSCALRILLSNSVSSVPTLV